MIHYKDIASIYNEHLNDLYSYGLHLNFEDEIVMDAIHDVFYKLCINQASLSEISDLKFYLFRALRNRLIDILRTNKEYVRTLPIEDTTFDSLPFQLNVTIEDELINKEDIEEIHQKVVNLLDQLTARQREIIYLRYIQGYSYKEIAGLMQISVVACRNLTSKSISKLKDAHLPIPPLLLIYLAGISASETPDIGVWPFLN